MPYVEPDDGLPSLVDDLRALTEQWDSHWELNRGEPYNEYVDGVESGYQRAADSLRELLTRHAKEQP